MQLFRAARTQLLSCAASVPSGADHTKYRPLPNQQSRSARPGVSWAAFHQLSALNYQLDLSRPRMKLPVHRFQPLLIDVRIKLRRGNIGVTEHLLDDAQVGAVAQKMGGKTMPEQVRINIFF